MLERLRARLGRRSSKVEFCDGCGTVCDAACRARAGREAALDRALRAGMLR